MAKAKVKTYNVQSCAQFYVKGISYYGPVNNIVLDDQEVAVLKTCGIVVVPTVKSGVSVPVTESKPTDAVVPTETAPVSEKPENKKKNK